MYKYTLYKEQIIMFFKYFDGELLNAPNAVLNKDYELYIENKDNYAYPTQLATKLNIPINPNPIKKLG